MIMEELQVADAIWTSAQRLPPHISPDAVGCVLLAEMSYNRHVKLGDTIFVRIPKRFEPRKTMVADIIGWDKWGPIYELDPVIPFTWTGMANEQRNEPGDAQRAGVSKGSEYGSKAPAD